MEWCIDDKGIMYDVVKYHTLKKHEFIKRYLGIWVEMVKTKPPTLDIFDLYASTGMCYCEDAEGHRAESSWDGSAMLSAKCLMKYRGGSRCLFLNTYNKDKKMIPAQKENLKRLLSEIKFPYPYIIETLPIDQAVDVAITKVEPRYPNLWILDPHGVSALPWSVVEKISNLKGEYDINGKHHVRKPELIISLMTEDLQRWYKTRPEIITIALGMDKSSWRPIFEELVHSGLNTRDAFLNVYMQRLCDLYDKSPICIEVNTTNETAVLYTIMLITESDAGYYLTQTKLLPAYEDWRVTTWKNGARNIVQENKGQKTLFSNY